MKKTFIYNEGLNLLPEEKHIGGFIYMVKWNIFSRSKSKKIEPQTYQDSSQTLSENYSSNEAEENLTFEKETEDQPIVDYHETLQTKDSAHKEYTGSSSDQRIWRNVRAIEKNIDKINTSKSRKPTSELEKKVDNIIKKKEKK